jgi:hypothetical protein
VRVKLHCINHRAESRRKERKFVSRVFELVIGVPAYVMYTRYMKLSIRRLVLCLLLLVAIPFQGLASAAMVACEFGHSASTIGHASQPDAHDTQHAHDTAHTHDTQHIQTGDTASEHATQHSCCSACVMSALDGLMVLSQPLSNSTQFNYSSATHLPPTLAGLERPPRSHLG